MTTKDLQLKTRLIWNGVLVIGVLVVLLVIAAVVSNHDDDAQSDERLKENANNTVRGEYTALKNQLETGSEISEFYEAYVKNHSSNFVIDREAMPKLLAVLRDKHYIDDLDLTISPVTEIPASTMGIKSGTLVKSDVKITFTALTDNAVYGFITALQREAPGFVVIQELKINRNRDLSRNVLQDLGNHKLTSMVNGELYFMWIGIRLTPEEKPAATEGHGINGK